MADEKSGTVSKQDITNIFKAVSKGRSSAGKLLWVLIGNYLRRSERTAYNSKDNTPCLSLSDYKELLPYSTLCYSRGAIQGKGADELQVYRDLDKDLGFIKTAIDQEKNECNYIVFGEKIAFTFPEGFLKNFKDNNPFQFCFEE